MLTKLSLLKALFKPLFKATPFKFTLLFSLLFMVAAMLAIAVIYFQSYAVTETAAKQRLAKEMARLSFTTQPLRYLPTDMRAVVLSDHLPPTIDKDWSKHPGFISATNIHTLNWSQYGIHDRAWVGLIQQDKGYLAIVLPMQPIRLLPLLEVLLYLFVVIIALMSAYGALINRRTMRRVEQINETANSILQGDMNKRITESPYQQDEYSRLVKTLNDMLDTMQQLMRDLRQINQNIAHDLKTPLNRLRSRLEVSLLQDQQTVEFPEVVADSIEDIDALLATFNALLLMGNLDSKAANYPLKPIALDHLLHDLAALYEVIAEEKQYHWQVHISNSIRVFAHRDLLSQCLSNLLDNAIKYTTEKGQITLSLKQQGDFAVISIADNGPGIPDADKTTVFEPFSRLDSSRNLPGNGLGMSLVRSIIEIHHARIELLDNHPGLLVNLYFRLL